MSVLLSLLLLFLVPPPNLSISPPTPAPCGSHCTFRLCSFPDQTPLPTSPYITLNAPLQANFPYICRANERVGRILQTGEAHIVNDSQQLTPISQWNPSGLPRPFPNDFFAAKPVPYYPFSGISRGRTFRNFRRFLHDRCVVLPIRRYEELKGRRRLTKREVGVGRGLENCVAFRTIAPVIYLELNWDSKDDLDLEVIEPNGRVLQESGEGGRVLRRSASACRSRVKTRKEEAWYLGDAVEAGNYTVRVRQVQRCATELDSVWGLTLVRDHVTIGMRYGMGQREGGGVLHEEQFQFP